MAGAAAGEGDGWPDQARSSCNRPLALEKLGPSQHPSPTHQLTQNVWGHSIQACLCQACRSHSKEAHTPMPVRAAVTRVHGGAQRLETGALETHRTGFTSLLCGSQAQPQEIFQASVSTFIIKMRIAVRFICTIFLHCKIYITT